MARLFGTDGVRGVANRELTAELVVRLGRAAGQVLVQGEAEHPLVLVGRDPRRSGEMIEAAIASGLCSAGMEVTLVGVVPTAAMAHLVRARAARAAAMISASHNPYEFNGIKFFSGDGFKLPDAVEDEIEQALGRHRALPVGEGVGRVRSDPAAVAAYEKHLVAQADCSLAGMRVVVDCANGAASGLAVEVLGELGAEVIALADGPDGANINAGCGALFPERMCQVTAEQGADLGVALDGDADRAIFSDERGNRVDGDQVLAIMAAQGSLSPRVVVGTVMSNLGLEQALAGMGCMLVRSKVGDRYVLEEMRRTGAILGGEPSGHTIFLDRETTGDGLLTAIRLAGVMQRTGKRLSSLAGIMQRLPQALVNVPVPENGAWQDDRAIAAAIRETERRLGRHGRLLVRASGTEPVIRIMVEHQDEAQVVAFAEELAEVIRGRGR